MISWRGYRLKLNPFPTRRSSDLEPLAGDPGLPQAQRLAGKVAIVTGAGSRPAGPDGPVIGNGRATAIVLARRSEEHTSELQSRLHLVCRLLREKKKSDVDKERGL